MVFPEEIGDILVGFGELSDTQTAVHLRTAEGKTTRSEPETGSGSGTGAEKGCSGTLLSAFSPSFNSRRCVLKVFSEVRNTRAPPFLIFLYGNQV